MGLHALPRVPIFNICQNSKHVRLNAAAFSIFQGKYKIKGDMRDEGNNRRIACLEAELQITG